ncbi:MAG TPA: acyl-CoA dehydrogenase family protein [Vicinamibacterales bacterium]|nr:acyl-CoA dehydrogenase family protein [Vicinamibacterales bacterium]
MTTAALSPQLLRGGEWLLRPTDPEAVFTPERLTEEHRLIAKTTREFVQNEVLPELQRLEQKDWDLVRRLMRRAAELGLLGVDAPETYGGLGLDKVTSLVVSENMSRSASFGAAFGAQVNLTIVPLHLFGTEAQKEKYLPGLLSGEIIGAYGLSESGSGSDALGARTRATRQPDGSFLLNGEKMWITNGGFADVFVVFAKVDGEQFTAFLVERAFGVKSGKEEHKMGLNGSSTTSLTFQDVRVPAENVLGEVGKGHKVAFNVLNFARFKLGGMCGGGSMGAIAESSKYAATRRQFGQPIASFGAIRHKIGEMVVRAYAIESLLYRTAGLVDASIARTLSASPSPSTSGSATDEPAAALQAFEEYAVESSIAKVVGSETLNFVLDENIQIHGGNGFVSDYPAERQFRDSRVNRIFEGTNEINRLLIPGMLVRRALKGDLALIPAAKALQDELLGPSVFADESDSPLGNEQRAIESFKKIVLMVMGTALQTYGQKLSDEQEVLMYAADILMDTYAAESAVLRARAAINHASSRSALHTDAARVFVNDAALRIDAAAKQALASMAEGDTLRTLLGALRRLTKTTPINTTTPRRRLADEAVSRGGYVF